MEADVKDKVGMWRALVCGTAALGMLAGSGCSSQPVTTGAAAYWEVAHGEDVQARSEIQEDAAQTFYPSPEPFTPTWDLVDDYSKSGVPGVDEHRQDHVEKGSREGGTKRSTDVPEQAGPQNKAGQQH